MGRAVCFSWRQFRFQFSNLGAFHRSFFLNSFSKFVNNQCFSDWLVALVVHSIFCIVLIYYRSQSFPSNGCTPFQSLLGIIRFFRIPLISASTVIFTEGFHSFLLTT